MRIIMWLRLAAAALVVVAMSGTAGAVGYVDTLTDMGGLISYWNLNEPSGLSAADLVTNDIVDGNNPGSYSGSGLTVGAPGVRPADGFLGFAEDNRAPVFSDKSSDILQMPNYTGYGNRTDLTMIGWMKLNEPNAGVEAHFGGLERFGTGRYLFAAHYDARFSDLRARIRNTVLFDEYELMSRLFIPDDQQWHLFAMTYEAGTTMRLYLDGWQRDADSFALSGGLIVPLALVFGHDADFTNAPLRGFNGQLDELAFFDRAITPQEVKRLWDAATLPELGKTATAPYRQTAQKLGGLRNYWRFDETAGTTFVDATAGNNGTLTTVSGFPANVGRPGPSPTDEFAGMPTDNASLQFVAPDGVGYVSTQNGQVLGSPTTGLPFGDGGVNEMTMSLWFKNTYDAAGYVAGFERSGDARYVFAAHHPTGTAMRFYARAMNEEEIISGDIQIDVPGDYLWHHLVQVWDGSEKRLTVYIDGREQYSNTNDLMSEYLAVPEGFFVGRDQLGDMRDLGGFVDEISLFDRALSAAEAFELYDAAFFAGPAPRVPGDATGDGVVNAADASLLAANWLKSSGVAWEQGDFNEDGKVDDLDLAILSANWSAAGGAAVPEPGGWILAVAAGVLLVRKKVVRLVCHWSVFLFNLEECRTMKANGVLGLAAAVLVLVACCGTAQAEYMSALTGMSGLVSYWNLNETTGVTAVDSVASDSLDGDNPGTYSGAGVALGAAGPRPSDGFLGFSATNNSASFSDDQNTKLQMATYLPYAGVKDLSLVTWVRFPSVPTSSSDRRAVGGLQRDTADSRYIFATALYNPTPAGLQGFVRRSDGSGSSMSRYLGDVSAWRMWVLTLEGGQTAKCYLDGQLKETYTFADNTFGLDAATGLVFGNDIRVSANRPWKGELDEIAMFSRALSGTEVATLFNAAVIPEPSALVLVVLGIACLAALRGRRWA